MTYTKQLLYSIADQMKRDRRDMDHFIQVLEKNWYDTKQSLRTLTIKDYDRFKIPSRLAMLIMQKTGSSDTQKSHIKGSNTIKQTNDNMMDIEESIRDYIESMKRRTSPDMFNQCIDTHVVIFGNIRQNPLNEKFRILKKSNKKISQLLSIPENIKILLYGGFQESKDTLTMQNVSLTKIDECIEVISKYQELPQFNPYEAVIMSTVRQPKMEGQSSVIFNDKLKELEDQRMRVMSRPIKDRDIRIYQQKKSQLKPESGWFEERDATEEEKMFSESIREQLKHYGEDPKFMNRRKQQYFQLLKKPVYSQTLIRIKLPDNWIFECKFSPMETLEDLVEIFHEQLENKELSYYLYMTPPVQKLSGRILRSTFYDKQCVPSALFYLGSEQPIKGNIFKTKQSIIKSIFRK